MAAVALLSLRPLFSDLDIPLASRAMPLLAIVSGLVAALFALGAATAPAAPEPSSLQAEPAIDPSRSRKRKLFLAARIFAAFAVVASLAVRLREAELSFTPAVFWLAALAAATLAAWLCVHLRASLLRARFYWAIALGALLAVISALDRSGAPRDVAPPSAQPAATSTWQQLEPGPGVNIVFAVGALLLGEGHPDAELFALAPLYAPATSAVESRTPWFRHLAALLASLFAGLLVLGLRSANISARGRGVAAFLLALLATVSLAVPLAAPLASLLGPGPGSASWQNAFDGVALWLLAAAASLPA